MSGRLTTGQPRIGLSGVAVKLEWINANGLFTTGIVKARTTTDADGNYSLNFHIDDKELTQGRFALYFNPDADQYYTFGPDRNSLSLNKLARNMATIAPSYHFPRKAYVHLAITNQAELQAAGYRGFFSSSFSTCSATCTVFSRTIQGGGPLIFWDGLPVENPTPVPGDQAILLRSDKTKDGINTYTTDSLFIPAGTTSNITVTY